MLIVRVPTFAHEIMSHLLRTLPTDRRPIPSLQEPEDGGSTNVDLENGSSKSPDWSHYDPNRSSAEIPDDLAQYQRACPTMVWEVAFSENSRQLGRDCAGWVGGSGGNTFKAVGLCVDAGPPLDRRLKALTVLNGPAQDSMRLLSRSYLRRSGRSRSESSSLVV